MIMGNRNVTKFVPFEVKEVVFINRIVKAMDYTKENIPTSNGKFSTIKLTTIKGFDFENLRLLQRSYKDRFGSNLKLDNKKNGEVNICYLSKG